MAQHNDVGLRAFEGAVQHAVFEKHDEATQRGLVPVERQQVLCFVLALQQRGHVSTAKHEPSQVEPLGPQRGYGGLQRLLTLAGAALKIGLERQQQSRVRPLPVGALGEVQHYGRHRALSLAVANAVKKQRT